jgi:cytoskeletal protein CcmA (bactofilin family)
MGTNVTIQAGAHVEGNITHETISIENGAYVYGSMRQGGIAQPPKQPMPAPHEPYFKAPQQLEIENAPDNVRPLKTAKP